MAIFWRREKEVKEKLFEYFRIVDEAVAKFGETMRCYLERGSCQAFLDGDLEIHMYESKADDLRRDIEKTLYGRALLPESRGDILGLLETFDKIPNLVETITFMIDTQQINIPTQFKDSLSEILDVNLEAYSLVRKQVDMLFTDPDSVGKAVGPVDEAESKSDKLERALIRKVFRSDVHRVDMLLLRELITKVGDISDHSENVSRRLEIISLKRRF